MSDLVSRFRPKVGSYELAVLSTMLDVAISESSHHPENEVGRALETFSFEDGTAAEVRRALELDSLALLLTERHGGAWGNTHFGPWGSSTLTTGEVITNPRRDRITSEALDHWRSRAEHAEHAVARARFADAAWDLAKLVEVKKRRDDALLAIDAYLAACTGVRSELHIERCFRRAHELSRSIGDTERVASVRHALMERCLESGGRATQRLRFLAADLYLSDCCPNAEAEEVAKIVAWMEEGLKKCVEEGNPFGGERFADVLTAYFKQRSNTDAHKRVATAFGGLLESWAAKGSGMLAMHNYKKAHQVYQAAGLSKQARVAREKVQIATTQSRDEMAPISATVEIPDSDIQTFIEGVVANDWPTGLHRFVSAFRHRRAELEKHLVTWLENSVIDRFVPTTVITLSGDSVELKSVEVDRESHLIFKGAEVIQFAEHFMRLVIDRLFERYDFSPEHFLGIVDESPLFLPDRRGIMERAFSAYCLCDYPTFLHLAIPQVEHAIRRLFQLATSKATTTSRDSKRWRTVTLNQILDDHSLAAYIGDDSALYLRAVLTHDLGMNMRNVVCHGFAGDGWFNRGHADRLLHVVLLLALMIRRRVETSGEPPESDMSGTESSSTA